MLPKICFAYGLSQKPLRLNKFLPAPQRNATLNRVLPTRVTLPKVGRSRRERRRDGLELEEMPRSATGALAESAAGTAPVFITPQRKRLRSHAGLT